MTLLVIARDSEWQDPTFDAVWWHCYVHPAWPRHLIVRFGIDRLWYWAGERWTFRASEATVFPSVDAAWYVGEVLQDGNVDVGELA